MTYTLNGIGTGIRGTRQLTDAEFKEWSEHFPYATHLTKQHYFIGTEAFVVLFVPIIPLKTFVFYYIDGKRYRIVYYPAGEGKVYWEHVKGSPSFYAGFILAILFVIFIVFLFH